MLLLRGPCLAPSRQMRTKRAVGTFQGPQANLTPTLSELLRICSSLAYAPQLSQTLVAATVPVHNLVRCQTHKSFEHRHREHKASMASTALILALCASACALAPVKAPASTQPRNNILSVPERIAQSAVSSATASLHDGAA